MEKKYKFTEETLEIDGHVLHRIIALRDFGEVKKGDLGGFIEKESNLAHDWNCWIYNDAVVRDDAMVYGNAIVYDNAMVYGNAEVYGNAKVCGNAKVEKNPTTSCSRIGGVAEDTSRGHARTICGLLDASMVLAKNSSRKLMLTMRRRAVSMRELLNM